MLKNRIEEYKKDLGQTQHISGKMVGISYNSCCWKRKGYLDSYGT
nr:hypothetical protein [uncultured Peptostreptococcus sp.]